MEVLSALAAGCDGEGGVPVAALVQGDAVELCRGPCVVGARLEPVGAERAPVTDPEAQTHAVSPLSTSAPDAGAGANLLALLRTRRVLRVGSARASSVACFPRRPLVMGILNDAVD